MQIWNDALRICTKCQTAIEYAGEGKSKCPKCGSTVWLFNYRSLDEPPASPARKAYRFWDFPGSYLLASTVGMAVCLIAAAFFARSILLVICGAVVAALGAACYLLHRHAGELEASQQDYERLFEYANRQRDRVADCVKRYNVLLHTGDQRVTHYAAQLDAWRKEEERKLSEERELSDEQLRQAVGLREAAGTVEERISTMAARFINDHCKWVAGRTRPDPDSYLRNKDQLVKAFQFVKTIGYDTPKELERDALNRLKREYQEKIREAALKEEQRRIAAQMRDEERVRRERELELEEAEAREKEIKARLERVLLEERGAHNARVEDLERQLEEAKAASQRAKSMAELTKVGHVYILSNIGSFGENVYKVGMTRRLDPTERVLELGDASVPFPFDVHAMIYCENAPKLENALHQALSRHRVNRVNLRKEFFQVDLKRIIAVVEQNHGVVEYVAEAAALQYRESESITPDQVEDYERELEELGVDLGDEEL